jgi:hypothetical protein
MPEQTLGRIADLPLEERRRLEVGKQRELQEGLDRRLVSIATYRQRYLADQFARLLSIGKRKG